MIKTLSNFFNKLYSNVVVATLVVSFGLIILPLVDTSVDGSKYLAAAQAIAVLATLLYFLGNELDHSRIKRLIKSKSKSKPKPKPKPKGVADADALLKHESSLQLILKEKPKVVLYVTGIDDVAYQGNMWIPVLEKLDVKCAIVIRESATRDGFIPTFLSVYYMKSMRDLELLEQAGVKTILYPANTMKNTQTYRFYRLNHFFINHGESDKAVNQSKVLRVYDKLLVAGPIAERRLKDANLRLHEDQVVHVGRPQVELSLEMIDSPQDEIKTILYAPTWEGFVEEANYSSVNAFGYAMVESLIKNGSYEILYKPHPFTGRDKNGVTCQYVYKMKELMMTSDRVTIYGNDANIHDLINLSDLMITDVSSVLNDYLYTRKPMILTNPRGQGRDEFRIAFPTSTATYILDQAGDILCAVEAIVSNDRLWDERLEICKQSLGDFPEGSLSRFNQVVCDSVK